MSHTTTMKAPPVATPCNTCMTNDTMNPAKVLKSSLTLWSGLSMLASELIR